MLIPESKSDKEMAYLHRFQRWVATRPERERAFFCDHGKYVGYKSALAYLCTECSEE